MLQGDFGTSFRYSDPVITLIGERLPATIELAIVSMLIAIVLGVPLGVWAGAKPNSWADNLGSFFGFFGISMPSFWFGIMLILVVSGYFNWLPSSGRSTYGDRARLGDRLLHHCEPVLGQFPGGVGRGASTSSCRRSRSAPT